MTTLKHKILGTQLFTQDEKSEILATMDTYSAGDIRELESIIDEYDARFRQIMDTFRLNLLEELDSIIDKAAPDRKKQLITAADTIRSGLSAITHIGR